MQLLLLDAADLAYDAAEKRGCGERARKGRRDVEKIREAMVPVMVAADWRRVVLRLEEALELVDCGQLRWLLSKAKHNLSEQMADEARRRRLHRRRVRQRQRQRVAEKRACYEKVLGVEAGSNMRTIRKAHRKLSLQLHPDKNPNQSAVEIDRYKRVNSAYTSLSELLL